MKLKATSGSKTKSRSYGQCRYFLSALMLILLLVQSIGNARAQNDLSAVLLNILLSDDDEPSKVERLFEIRDMAYLGAFRIDSGIYGGDDTTFSTNYAVGTLAYNPNNHSLFIAGHAQASRVAEFAIPALGQQSKVADLPESEAPLQNFVTVFPASNNQGINRITGMLVYENALIINAEEWYNADGQNTDTTLVVTDANNLAGEIKGFFQLDGRANSAGYMGRIPADLRASLGGNTHFTGWSSVYSIVSRYSYSPSLWGFSPNVLLAADPTTDAHVSATPFMNFAYSSELKALFDAYDPNAQASPLWNILSNGMFGFFVEGTRTFAVIGSSGGIASGIGYKITQTNGNVCGGYCTYDPADNYNYYWLYDVDEIAAAQSVSAPRPYAFGKLNLPFDDNGSHKVIGGTLDTSTNTLYVALANAGQVGTYDRPPLIVVFNLGHDNR